MRRICRTPRPRIIPSSPDRPAAAGRIELADGGTLFLDEVGSISMKTQVDLLRVLETHELTRLGGTQAVPVDFRVICATNEDPENHVLRRFGMQMETRVRSISPDAMALLQAHDWPGNVREL